MQYEVFIKNQWKPIARYDTAHNFVHLDIIYADGSVAKQRIPILDYNDAYTFADLNLKATFKKHKERFMKEREEYYEDTELKQINQRLAERLKRQGEQIVYVLIKRIPKINVFRISSPK